MAQTNKAHLGTSAHLNSSTSLPRWSLMKSRERVDRLCSRARLPNPSRTLAAAGGKRSSARRQHDVVAPRGGRARGTARGDAARRTCARSGARWHRPSSGSGEQWREDQRRDQRERRRAHKVVDRRGRAERLCFACGAYSGSLSLNRKTELKN
jgi:hypothetical protein